jgi:type IV secretory pathway TrbL component
MIAPSLHAHLLPVDLLRRSIDLAARYHVVALCYGFICLSALSVTIYLKSEG